MKALFRCRTACLLLAGLLLAGGIAIRSASAPILNIERVSEGHVLVTWTNDGAGYVVQEKHPFAEPGLWHTMSETPQVLDGWLAVTLPVQTNQSHYFRVKARGVEFTNRHEVLCWQTNGTFDALPLLSLDSIKDPFQLHWTISSNTVGATVSPAGVVALGTNAGSFTVTASATNPVCEDSFLLQTIRLELATNVASICWQSNGVFDAKALLTADSLTNDNMLAWTITGTGPASIDGAGLVSIGPGPGSYQVTVTDRSNAACVASLALDVLKLEFITNAATLCWQSNGTFNARALLSSDSTSNDSLLAWTISGSGPATIGSTGVVSFGPTSGSYTVQVAGRSNGMCVASLALEVTKVELASHAATACWQSNGVFDAKALLTTDSLTNDSLLAWTIAGSGPATIDAAGLVSFGPAPGSYQVTVTDRSNAVCAPSLSLDVLKVEFVTNAATVCWQSNGTFNARALLTSDSTTNDSLLAWSMVGSGPATIDAAGVVNLGLTSGSYTVQVAGRSNGLCAAGLTLEVVKVEFATNAATVCWQSNGMFDAKALLTADSLTNESLLTWTIGGSGPASIDSAGLVSFGPAPGSYLVQVTDRSNAVCVSFLALDVLKVEFVTNAASVCWQTNGVFDAKALLTSDSTTNDSLLAWTITGSGPATIAAAGVVSFGAAPGSYSVQVAGRSNGLCAASLALDVIKLEFATNAATVCWQSNGVFDARALLTADSLTNESLLTWRVSGSGPASIDSAGLVNFGHGPGSYLVQVTDWSNAVCVSSLALDVLKMEFATNAATVCWQTNGMLDARALLTADSTTNDSLLAWTMVGSGPATIDSIGLVSIGSASGSYTVQVAGRSNGVCAAVLALDVLKLEFVTNAATVCWQSNGVVDASALLTADSTTNDSLLAWTISGSGPASIDSAGLVSLGSGAGNYTVQVAGRSNAACAASLTLEVIKLELSTTAATVCWQSNGVFDAKALLTADSITNDSLLAWSITGSGPATIDSAGLVTFGPAPGSYVVQVTDWSNAVCVASLTLDVLKLEFVTNAAVVCWQTNGTFDARALLSSNSTTNDSLLVWALVGGGPATIDNAGLVSVGAASGSYTVQVGGRSNGLCAASLALEVIKLEFVTNAATVCWQSNGVFDAKGLLTADSLTNDVLLAWSITGSGPATIDNAGLVSLGPAPGSYQVMVSDRSNGLCAASLALDVLNLGFVTNAATLCWQSNGVFDARALLTADSTTNDSLLAWSIAGSGPATIDSAGLVSVGSSSGTYTVQVAGRSNAACAAALALEVLKLEFITNAATVCWQSNGTFDAKALLTADSTTNDNLLAWTIAGSGPATIDSAGLVNFGAASGTYTVQVTDRSNAVCAASLTLEVIKLELSTNAATVCWQSNGVFDAKALLTADSVTNDSLLTWTISGSGPASIDGAGLVSFGPGPGSYQIQVTDWSNAVCVSSLALDVLKVEFVTNAASVCWQTNGTFDARMLLSSDSTTNDSLLAWSITGSGPATVDSVGLVSVGASSGTYTVQVAGRSNGVCAASLVLDVLKLEFATNAATVCWQSNGVFDAKALLSADSLTNNALLLWTITGSGPATIDHAGLVSFGPAPGSYHVQVTDRSNAVCAPSLTLDVLKVDFVTNGVTVCWQTNGVFDARALLTSDSTTNDGLLAWNMVGSGPATIDGAGVVNFGSASGSYTVQVAGQSNGVCAAGLTLEVIKVELASHAAMVCWQSNGVFDAKGLLTADSLTNDSLLTWTISGDGPGSIDSAGLVSFGPGPGSYLVQVTDWSNAVCVASLALEVLKVEFVTNAAAVCWQSNGVFNAKALLTAGSTTNDNLLVWALVGGGAATIDNAGLVSVGASSGTYTVQVAGRSNGLCAASLALDVLKLEFATNAATVCWQSNGVFDAKGLLTADSLTNDSLLAWSIAGSGPATIDSAGLVTFGPAPGSYVVQVTDRSNAVCAPCLTLDVLKLEFATNAAIVCWQTNGAFDARALLSSDSTTNNSLLAWSIVGSGPATIDAAGVVNFGAASGSYTVQVAGRSNGLCAASLVLEVLKLEFATQAATVCWQSNGVFDAKVLLTSGSTTNDSFLAWSITGSGPAAIDSAGLVSLGSGAGSYTVQVAGRSNGLCAAALALDVIKLGFATNAATVCWQSNGTLNAKALLTATSTTNDSLLAWTVTGTGPATINDTGVVSFGPAAGSYAVQVAARSNAACAASFALNVIRLEFGSSQAATCWQSNGTFNAKALLTTNSTTDDSLLLWTIWGNPPASIDGAGVVTFGAGGGNYSVYVQARTNAACAATLSLGVTKVDFIKNQVITNWQSGGTFNARTLLASDGITNAAALDWSIAGSPSATINTSGVVTLGSGGGSYTIQAAAKGALPCSDTLALVAVEARVKAISFVSAGVGHGGSNQHQLYENADPSNWGDGGAITNPVWIAGTNNQPVRNAPACYTGSGAAVSKVRAQVVFNVKPAGQTFNCIGLDQSTEYFRTNGILSTGADQAIDVIASVALTNTVQKLSKRFTWRAIVPDGALNVTCSAGQSTNTIYTVYATPITVVEGQTNRPTPYRLDFCIVGVAAGLSNKVAICSNIAAEVRAMTGDSYGGMVQNPRWTFYAEPLPRNLDCHHRAALAANGFGVLGIQGYVHRTFATCYPVPPAPQYFPTNSTVNDYEGTYLTATRLKYRQVGSDIHKLLFLGNNFEGCVRVEDGSADDGNTWWTIWPLAQYDNAKALIIDYTGAGGGCPERWEELDGTWVADEVVPVDHLADRVKIIGGPD